MGKYLKEFGLTSQYEEYINSTMALLPNVSLTNDDNIVHYNPIVGDTVIDYSQQYLTFEALGDGTFSFKKNGTGDDIQYSKDNGTTWASLASGETINAVTGDKVVWKSTITPGTKGIGTFSSTGSYNVEGNIMSLLYGDDFKDNVTLVGKNYAFYQLFNRSTKLINTSNLILPAITLTKDCYCCMFMYCTSLTSVPKLPATTLADSCYYSMFNGCTSLTTAPELSATVLTNYCYFCMFEGCSKLNNIVMLATNIKAANCLYGWVDGVSSTGTFIKHPNMTSLPTGISGIPEGWTVVDYVA